MNDVYLHIFQYTYFSCYMYVYICSKPIQKYFLFQKLVRFNCNCKCASVYLFPIYAIHVCFVSIYISNVKHLIFKPFPLARSKRDVVAVENSGSFWRTTFGVSSFTRKKKQIYIWDHPLSAYAKRSKILNLPPSEYASVLLKHHSPSLPVYKILFINK